VLVADVRVLSHQLFEQSNQIGKQLNQIAALNDTVN
jgi:hypothetical protein